MIEGMTPRAAASEALASNENSPRDEPQCRAPAPRDRAATPILFKEALARLASGLAIVSYWDEGRPGGLLVSSITGLSLEPPRFLFCVQKSASSHDPLLRSDVCGVTILSAEERDEMRTFIEPSLRNSRFEHERWRLAAPVPPLLKGALSSSACSITQKIDAGSHTILIVTARTIQVSDGEPLLSFNRNVRLLAEHTTEDPGGRPAAAC